MNRNMMKITVAQGTPEAAALHEAGTASHWVEMFGHKWLVAGMTNSDNGEATYELMRKLSP